MGRLPLYPDQRGPTGLTGGLKPVSDLAGMDVTPIMNPTLEDQDVRDTGNAFTQVTQAASQSTANRRRQILAAV